MLQICMRNASVMGAIGGLAVSGFVVQHPFNVRLPGLMTPELLRRPTTTLFLAKPKRGCIVEVECSMRPEGDFIPEPLIDGIVLDPSDPPRRLAFVLGEGNYLPGLHDVILNMDDIGDHVENVTVDAGWGDWNPALNMSVSFASLEGSTVDKSRIQVGTELFLANGAVAIVTNVGEDDFVIDANAPLVGASYLVDVKLLSVDPGPLEFTYSPEANKCSKYQVATVALGCFWGAELAYMREPGVVGTKVGYTQGKTKNPSYDKVCGGETGHAESVMITYDPNIVSYGRLVHLAMDRLGENKYLVDQVGNDSGSQYRHGICYHNDEQKGMASKLVQSFGEDCVTEVLPAKVFYDAEPYHMQYLLKGGQSAKKGDLSTIRCYG